MIQDEDKIYFDLERVPLKSEREENKRKRRSRFLTILLCLFFFVLGAITLKLIESFVFPSSDFKSTDVMGEIEYMFENYWLYSKDHEDLANELEDKAFYGMSNFAEDTYTSYMSVKEMSEFSDSINMDYVGIGVQYSKYDGIAIVSKVFKDSPAMKAGILAGDIIQAIDGVKIDDKTTDEIKDMVIGPEGTDVVITVTRDGKDLDLTCTRASINSSVYAYRENDYVVMELNSFGANTAQECVRYLDEFADLEKIIIDIREDTGGYQSAVQEVCGLFIGDNKVYLRQKGVDGREQFDYTKAIKHYDNFKKIVILTNGNTASAAEVFAICMKESHPDVTLVGTTTFGKGVIQINKSLSNGAVLKMTAYHWYSPNGNSIDKTGIKPDVEVRQHDINYEYYSAMAEDEKYELDSVSDSVRICQLALDFLDYQIDRTDGYFDESLAKALLSYKSERGMAADSVLDKDTFEAVISSASREISQNESKDLQMMKAKEIINGN